MQSNQVDRAQKTGGVICSIMQGSIGDSLGLRKGDLLHRVNGVTLYDILDYRFQIAEESVELEIFRGEERLVFETEKDYDEDLGVEFEDVLFDQIRRCKNNCDFCFIYQLPKKMRRSLYIKDDDYRLSFLYGNYVTLAGLKDEDYEKITSYFLSPLYVSVHATNLEKRRELLKNPKAEDIIERIEYLLDYGIQVFTQAVVCPGLNDGEVLEETMLELSKLYPRVKALGVVPVGLTQYQSRLKRMNPHTLEEARDCIRMVEKYQEKFIEEIGDPFVQVADEFYLKADLPFPDQRSYQDYDLLENGIGAARHFIDDFFEYYQPQMPAPREKVGIITGEDGKVIFDQYILPMLNPLHRRSLEVHEVHNRHFGESVTVSGLMVGQDILSQVQPGDFDRFLIPDNCLKFDSPVLLDDCHIDDLSRHLKAKIEPVATTGQDLVEAIFEA